MALNLVSSGRDVPNEINVIIEIPKDAEPVKYEVDKATGAIFVDRVLSTPMRYPCNYGYVPHTLCGDGDPVDVLVILPLPLIPGAVIRCRPVGMLRMSDESGEDDQDRRRAGQPTCSPTTTTSTISATCRHIGASASATSSRTTRIWSRENGSGWTAGAMPPRPGRKSSRASHASRTAPTSRHSDDRRSPPDSD